MIRGRCPICEHTFEIPTIGDHPSFPFCSERCRLIDLGRWIDGAYAIPATGDADPAPPEPDQMREDDEG